MRTILIAGLCAGMLAAAPAHAAPRFTCADAVWAMETIGEATLRILGSLHGATPEDEAFAKRCWAQHLEDKKPVRKKKK